jgi:hypothetical protein
MIAGAETNEFRNSAKDCHCRLCGDQAQHLAILKLCGTFPSDAKQTSPALN